MLFYSSIFHVVSCQLTSVPIKHQDIEPPIIINSIGQVRLGEVWFVVQICVVKSLTVHTYEMESKKAGKASFAYAWVLDETGEERER